MSNIDELIRERLNKLRTEAHIPSAEPSTSLPPPNKKSSVEEVESLLQQLSAQTDLEEKSMKERLDVDSQIRQRLEKLKAESGSLVSRFKNTTKSNDNFMVSSSGIRLEPMVDVASPPADIHDLDSDDSDSCVMCDSAPALACSGCFNDLYCQKCFSECHDPGENHQPRPLPTKRNK